MLTIKRQILKYRTPMYYAALLYERCCCAQCALSLLHLLDNCIGVRAPVHSVGMWHEASWCVCTASGHVLCLVVCMCLVAQLPYVPTPTPIAAGCDVESTKDDSRKSLQHTHHGVVRHALQHVLHRNLQDSVH